MIIEEIRDNPVDAVINHYGTVDSPYEGPSFIMPNGSFLNVKGVIKSHADVEFWLYQQGLSVVNDFNRRTGSPTLKALGCIRVDTPKYYVQLPDDNITSSQYSALKDWVDFTMSLSVPFLEVIAPDVYPVKYYFDDPEIDADYIVNRIRRYYITGNLYEAYKDPAD